MEREIRDRDGASRLAAPTPPVRRRADEPPPARLKKDGDVLLGSAYICLSAAMFAAAGASVKVILADLSPVVLVFWRNAVSLVLFMIWIFAVERASLSSMATSRSGTHLARSLFSVGVLDSYFYAVSEINLATAILFMSTGPIFVPILAMVVFAHRSDRMVWAGVLLAFGGVGLIVRPEAVDVSLGIAAGLTAGLLGGAATLVIWSMSDTEGAMKQMFYFSVFAVVLSLPAAIWHWQWPVVESYAAILALGVATTLAQYYLSKGCSVAPADKINTWNYLSIVIAALAAYIGWGEKPSLLAVAGMALVVTGAHVTTLKRGAR